MSQENLNLMKRLELLREYIDTECNEYIYYPPENQRRIFLRIKNAVAELFCSAFVYLKIRTAGGSVPPPEELLAQKPKLIAPDKTADLLTLIYYTLAEPDLPTGKELKIRGYIAQYGLNPDELLIP